MKIVLAVVLVLICIGVGVIFLGTRNTQDRLEKMTLLPHHSRAPSARVDFQKFVSLPKPVRQYFEAVLKDGQGLISSATFKQIGKLRTTVDATKWMSFKAIQHIYPFSPGFIWDAKVRLGPFHIRVIDSYLSGKGSGLVRLQSAITIGEANDTPQLNSGSLHRYLAEAVWYPTALLPTSGVQWGAIDESRALATLTSGNVSVSLEFRFGKDRLVTGIYSPGRWGLFDGNYEQVAWEGHFFNYTEIQGMLVPTKGEVGWYKDDQWKPVWKGSTQEALYEF